MTWFFLELWNVQWLANARKWVVIQNNWFYNVKTELWIVFHVNTINSKRWYAGSLLSLEELENSCQMGSFFIESLSEVSACSANAIALNIRESAEKSLLLLLHPEIGKAHRRSQFWELPHLILHCSLTVAILCRIQLVKLLYWAASLTGCNLRIFLIVLLPVIAGTIFVLLPLGPRELASVIAPNLAYCFVDCCVRGFSIFGVAVLILHQFLRKPCPFYYPGFRPISIMPVLCKVYQLLVSTRMCAFMETEGVSPRH